MKLKVTDWKHAWFESHISDRFFQEMSKLDHGPVQGLETSAQWMEQIMIEVGLLAQAMIRLEQSGAPEPQIRQAYDKSMRLAALAMQLITALDGAERQQFRSAAIVRSEHGAAAPPRSATPAQTPPLLPAQPAQPLQLAAPAPAPAAPAAAPGNPAQGGHPVSQPAAIAALTRGAQGVRPPPPAPRPERKAAASGAPAGTEGAVFAPATPGNGDAPVFSSLLQVSGRNVARSESHLHQTILSLSEQGLSRAEIEMVTGEPRHIIEAVLNHHRTQQQAGSSPS